MSRRDAIRLSEAEIRDYLEASRTLILCSQGSDGVPHPMPMWYGVDQDGDVIMTTFAKSQKVKNLERDPRVSLLIEDGEVYGELRGVVLYGKVQLEHDTERVLDVLARVTQRYGTGEGADPAAMREALRGQARKRVAMRVHPDRIVSWDHRKLGGTY
jgi:PPOX class probable F420-dependent enzyme